MNFNTGTREYIESIFNGQTPVEREHPLAGQSKYFYFKPGQRDDISVSDMETVDVPTADTPNPFLSGTSTNPYPSPIQNEIYNKDRSTCNRPYGSPTTQIQSNNSQPQTSLWNGVNIPEVGTDSRVGLYNPPNYTESKPQTLTDDSVWHLGMGQTYPQRPNNSFQSPASSTNMPRLPKFSSSNSYPTVTSPQKSAVWDNVKTWGNNFADATEAATVGYATGATLGNFDEAMGAATAAVTLNPDNYTMGRDAVRKLQNDLSHRHPYLYNGMEFFGAMHSPSYALSKEAFANKILNTGVGTLMASLGYAETPKDFLINLPVYGIANTVGSIVDKIPLWRAVGSTSGKFVAKNGPKFIKQGINSFADKLKNIYYNDDEKYHY